jgi:hypothetical protein
MKMDRRRWTGEGEEKTDRRRRRWTREDGQEKTDKR